MRIHAARVEFDREVAVGARAELELAAEAQDQLLHQLGLQEVRRAAAEVQLHHFAVAVEQRSDQADLALHMAQVLLAAAQVAGDDPVAAAVEAGRQAKGHVDVQRKCARNRVGIAFAGRAAIGGCVELRAEVRRGRVGGVARTGAVVAAQQLGIEGRDRRHGAQSCADAVRPR
jgi:hypothetical protein